MASTQLQSQQPFHSICSNISIDWTATVETAFIDPCELPYLTGRFQEVAALSQQRLVTQFSCQIMTHFPTLLRKLDPNTGGFQRADSPRSGQSVLPGQLVHLNHFANVCRVSQSS